MKADRYKQQTIPKLQQKMTENTDFSYHATTTNQKGPFRTTVDKRKDHDLIPLKKN